jgi:hypothetical protein
LNQFPEPLPRGQRPPPPNLPPIAVACGGGDNQPWKQRDFSRFFLGRFEESVAKVFDCEAWSIELLGFYRIAAIRARELENSIIKPIGEIHAILGDSMIMMAAAFAHVDELEKAALQDLWPENPPLDRLYYGWDGPGSSSNLEIIANGRKQLFDLWLSMMRLALEERHQHSDTATRVSDECLDQLFKIMGGDAVIWEEWIDVLVNAAYALVERTSRATVGVMGQ